MRNEICTRLAMQFFLRDTIGTANWLPVIGVRKAIVDCSIVFLNSIFSHYSYKLFLQF